MIVKEDARVGLSSEDRGKRMKLCVVFGVVFGLIASWFVFVGYTQISNGVNSVRWPFVEGTVIASTVEESGSRSSRGFSPKIRYVYAVAGVKYSGDRLSFVQDGVGLQWSKETVEQYPVGKRISVYYQPGNPNLSVLTPGGTMAWFMVTGGVAFAFIAVFLLPAYACFWDYQRVKNARFEGGVYYI